MPEVVMPHAVRFETDSTFHARTIRHKNRPSEYGDTSIFAYEGRNCIVGGEALSKGRPIRITGPDKYVKGHLDILLMAALQKLAPDGHQNVIIACAHTTDSVPYIDRISQAIGGKHKVIRYDGKAIDYVVRAMIPWDEPAGGLLRFMTHEGVGNQADMVEPGQKILVVDIGGKVSTMIPAKVLPGMKVQVLWGEGAPFPIGIQDIMKTLEGEMRALYPDVFSSKSIPDSIMKSALRNNGMTTVRNHPFDASQAVNNATGILLSELENVYVNEMDSGLDINHIVVTGGGGGLLFNSLQSEVLHHDFMYLADYTETINLANLRGGEYAMSLWCAENTRHMTSKTGESALLMVFDPGNSDLKFKVLGDTKRIA